ncbi:MAG: DUF3226 domain-containing protein [Chloroflexaceae bacterium]
MADRNILLVEGKDDEHVFYSLLMHHQVPEVFRIKNKDGVNNLLETLDVEIDRSGLERLGIVVDADTDLDARWQSLQDRLRMSGYPNVSAVPDLSGTIIEHPGRPKLGIWLMPDNAASGMLEDFVGYLVRQGDLLWDLAETSLQQIPEVERRFPETHWIKARIYTWLAWQEEPGKPMGQAITATYFDANASQAQQLITWLNRLFDLTP